MMILYGINLSTFTRKARLALAEKGLDYRLEVTPMGSTRLRALHPLGKIPVLEHDGVIVPDSSAILGYLERIHPVPALYPDAPAALARVLWLEEYADTRLREVTLPFFSEHVVKPVFQNRPADEAVLAASAAGRDEAFDYLERELRAGLLGAPGPVSAADIAVGAQLITYCQGAGEIAAARWPRLAQYLAALRPRPAWEAILAEEQESLNAARARRRLTPPADRT